MEKKLGKSVVATGIAATTLISGVVGNHVNADELTKPSQRSEQNDLEVTEIQKDLAKAQVDAQKDVVEKAKDELEKAQEANQNTQAQLNQAKEINKEASPEAVAEAKAEVNKVEAEVNANQASLNNSQNQELPSEQAVQQQENIVVGQRTLVDVAEREYNEAKAPIVREEQELAQAKAEEEQANQELAAKQANLVAVQQNIANSPSNTANLEKAIQTNQNEINKIQTAINQKEAELANTPQTETTTQAANTYQELLQNLQSQGATQEIRDAAANALALYKRSQAEDGLTVGSDSTSSATLENNLKAVEVIRAINNYRAQAGLPPLYVDPYANVASQIQSAFFEQNGRHMFKYIKNENVAISFTPKASVDFWYSEKALYQEIAARYNLPTDESQLDANDIYMKIGAAEFARVGHYLQMLDNKATAISASYNTVPNQYSSTNGTATVGFHQVGNLNQRLQNGTLMSLADYENLLASARQSRTNTNEKYAALKVEKTNREVRAGILNSQLNDLQSQSSDQAQLLANAQYQLLNAQDRVAAAARNTADKQQALENATRRYEAELEPKRLALDLAREKLAAESSKLESLRAALQSTKANTIEARKQLIDSQVRLKQVQERAKQLAQAPQQLSKARKAVASAKADLAAKETKYKAEESLLELYQEVHARLEAKHNQLRAKNAAKETAKDQPVDAKNVYQGEAIHQTQDKSSKAKQNVSATGVKTEQIGIIAAVAGFFGLAGVALKRFRRKS